MSGRSIAIVDGNSLLHRAFHALPITLTGVDGRPTNAVYGFLTMLFRLVEELQPHGVVVAFDCGKPQFRIDVLAHYKIHRPPTAPELKDQFPMIRHVLEAMEVPAVELEGWEGDDILGTVAEQAKNAGYEVLLITSDKDAMQLVDKDVRVVSSRRKIGDLAVYGPAEVRERFGVDPAQVPDFLGLMGDSSDNIPGVPGVGEKTAARLLAEYGSLDEVLAHAEDVGGKVGENLRAHAQDALDSRLVATIRRDVPVAVDLDNCTWGGWDPARVLGAFKELRVTSLVGKVFAEGEIRGFDQEEQRPGQRLPVLNGGEATRAIGAALASLPDYWIGTVSGSDSPDCLLPACDLAVALPDAIAIVREDAAPGVVSRLMAVARVSSPDIKSLVHTALEEDVETEFVAHSMFDASVAAYLLDSTKSTYDIQVLLTEIAGAPLAQSEDGSDRLAADAQAASEVAAPALDRLREAGSLECFERCEMPLIPVLARMERAGVSVDRGRLEAMASEMASEIELLTASIYELAGTEFNIDSPKQLGHVLFEKLHLPTGKRTKTGFSTDSSVLAPLAADYPVADKVLAYRELAKLKSTYVDALPRLLDEAGRAHTTFNQTVAATGRLSSSNPNLQNIPVRTGLGRRIRSAFVPGAGFDFLLAADYSQIELRILASLSGDPGLIEAFTSGMDFHTATAARVFGLDSSQVDAGLRNRAKATNFGIVYGISAHGLALQLDIGRAEAQEMIDRYYAAYPEVRRYLDESVASARESGYAVTMFGRRRPIPELASRNWNVRSFGERTAMNHPMQGAAADIVKMAMIEVDRRLREASFESRLVLQVHDELVFEVPAAEADAVSSLARGAMSGVAELQVPLVVDVAWGEDWSEAK